MIVPMLAVDVSHARARLRLEVVRAQAGKPFLVAVEIDTDPHWHVYWRNPGDSGVPTTIDWHAPKGWIVKPLDYPAPHRFTPGGVAAYGYEGKTLFLARVTPSSTPGSISARVKWLVCSNACIPGMASPIAKVPLGRWAPGPDALRLQRVVQSLPTPSSAVVRAQGGRQVVLSAPLTSSTLDWTHAEFFPEVSGVVDHAKPFLATLQGKKIVFKMDASPYPESRDHLPGLIVFSKGGRRMAVSVNPKLER